MSKLRTKAITIGKSKNICNYCNGELVIRKHSVITEKLRNKHYYFSQWEYCHPCNKVFFEERYKVLNAKGSDMEEYNNQQQHLLDIIKGA